jgi:hypothetical protein
MAQPSLPPPTADAFGGPEIAAGLMFASRKDLPGAAGDVSGASAERPGTEVSALRDTA